MHDPMHKKDHTFTVLARVRDRRSDAGAFTAGELKETLRQALSDLCLDCQLQVFASSEVLLLEAQAEHESSGKLLFGAKTMQ